MIHTLTATARFLGALVAVTAFSALAAIALIPTQLPLSGVLDVVATGFLAGVCSRAASLRWAMSLALFFATGTTCTMVAFYILSDFAFQHSADVAIVLLQWGMLLGAPVHLICGTVGRLIATAFWKLPVKEVWGGSTSNNLNDRDS